MHKSASGLPVFACFCLAISMFMVGANIAIGKLVILELPVFLFAVLRFFIASVVLLPGMFRSSFRQGLNFYAWRGLFIQ